MACCELRRYVSVACTRRCSVGAGVEGELVEDARDVLLHGGVADEEALRDAAVRLALRHRREHVALARTQPVDRALRHAPPQHPPDDLRIERAAAGGHAADRLDEGLDVADALLEQVADTLGAVADEVDGVALLVELREHQHADLGVARAELERGAQAVVLAARRHPHIHHRDIGTMRERATEEVVGISHLGDDLEARLGQQASDALA